MNYILVLCIYCFFALVAIGLGITAIELSKEFSTSVYKPYQNNTDIDQCTQWHYIYEMNRYIYYMACTPDHHCDKKYYDDECKAWCDNLAGCVTSMNMYIVPCGYEPDPNII